ncbi:MAG: hypothetical protein M5U22_14180 [Thermoleophilia bacterium]|nr:hypothetical protein [Thermoleophilia bacterium]
MNTMKMDVPPESVTLALSALIVEVMGDNEDDPCFVPVVLPSPESGAGAHRSALPAAHPSRTE